MTLTMCSTSSNKGHHNNSRLLADSNQDLIRTCYLVSNHRWANNKTWIKCSINNTNSNSREWWCNNNRIQWWVECRCSSQWACRWEETQCRTKCRIRCTANPKTRWIASNNLPWIKIIKCSWITNSNSNQINKCFRVCRWTQTRHSNHQMLSGSWTSETTPYLKMMIHSLITNVYEKERWWRNKWLLIIKLNQVFITFIQNPSKFIEHF